MLEIYPLEVTCIFSNILYLRVRINTYKRHPMLALASGLVMTPTALSVYVR